MRSTNEDIADKFLDPPLPTIHHYFHRSHTVDGDFHRGWSSYRFNDPLLLGAGFIPDGLQVGEISRQHEGLRKKAKLLLSELSEQPGKVAPQTVLAAQLE